MPDSKILVGDVRTRLTEIPDDSIQSCITSPPYWGLRDYGTASWDGGDSSCDHQGKPMATKANINRNCGTGNDVKNATAREFYKDICGRCGANRIDSQLGLEQTPDDYVANMVTVFREVRRVLKDDGVLWLNLGDSYVGGKGLKPKDLVGIPWRVAFALQADGWWLRQDIIWHKPNPMPESVTDRCTKSHEYLFMLTKSAKYYFDNEAIKEDAKWSSDKRAGEGRLTYDGKRQGANGTEQEAFVSIVDKRNRRSVWTIPTKPFRGAHFAVMPEALVEPCLLASTSGHGCCATCGSSYERIIEQGKIPERKTRDGMVGVIPGRTSTTRMNSVDMEVILKKTVGWRKTCDCPTQDIQPSTVMDPFTGSGTVAVVSLRHGRNFIGTELNPDYAEIATGRIDHERQRMPLLETIR